MTSIRRPEDADGAGQSVPRTSRRRGTRVAAPLAAAFLVAGALSVWSLTPQQAHAAEGHAAAADDFNGDGYADLVSGAPGATISGKAQAGYVAVTYGSAKGLDPSDKKLVSRSTAGVPGSAAAKEAFGKNFSKGDLDGDGYSDLVIGSGGGTQGAIVMWGSSSGLTGGTSFAKLGRTPQIGDFDGDGKADLALFGSADVDGDDPVTQQTSLLKGPVSRDGKPSAKLNFLDKSEWWGYENDDEGCAKDDSCVAGPHSVAGPVIAKATGDVNGDKRQDIAIWEYEGDGVWSDNVLLGAGSGFKSSGELGGIGSVGDDAATGLGDVDGDGYDDVVTGSADGGSDDDSSKVTVTYGSSKGPSADRTQSFDQTLAGFPGDQTSGDHLGSCVSVADVTGDGKAEIALGISGKEVGSLTDAGSAALLHGSTSGVTGTGSQVVTQDTAGVPGVAEKGDKFGAACALLDVNGDGHRDLAVSSTAENASAGALWSLNGTTDGFTATGAKAFGPGDVNGPVTKALFGSYLR